MRLEYTTFPSIVLASIEKQNISSSVVWHACLVGLISSTIALVLVMYWLLACVDLVPDLVCTMWPLSIADGGGKCFAINLYVKPGNEFSCPF